MRKYLAFVHSNEDFCLYLIPFYESLTIMSPELVKVKAGLIWYKQFLNKICLENKINNDYALLQTL